MIIGQKTPLPDGLLSVKRYSMRVKKATMKNRLSKASSNRKCQTHHSLLPHHLQKLNFTSIQSFAITHPHHNNLNLYSNLLFARNL